MQVQTIVTDIQAILNDTGITYPVDEILRYINDAQRIVCMYRADACSSTQSVPLVSGSKQSIPTTARRFIDPIRNMGADGATPGRGIRSTISMKDTNNISPFWHTEVGLDVIECFFDPSRPDEFYIYPQPQLPHYIEVKLANNPTPVTRLIDDIGIVEIYAPCLVSWAAYRLLSRDDDNSPNAQRAELHKNLTFELLGVKTRSDVSIDRGSE